DLGQVRKVSKAGTVQQRISAGIVDRRQPLSQTLGPFFRMAVSRHGAKSLAVIKRQASVSRSTEPVRLFQYRVKDRREVAGRRIDALQSLGGRGMLLQRLVTLGGAFGQPLLRIGEFALEVGDNLLRIG